jgi:hypothetical protein
LYETPPPIEISTTGKDTGGRVAPQPAPQPAPYPGGSGSVREGQDAASPGATLPTNLPPFADTAPPANVIDHGGTPGNGRAALFWTDGSTTVPKSTTENRANGRAVSGLANEAKRAVIEKAADNVMPANKSGRVQIGSPLTLSASPPFTDTAGVSAYLSAAPGGTSDDPIPLPVSLDLASDWANLLAAIQSAGKHVALDLSDCAMTGNAQGVMEFDPGIAGTGERKIVSLVLPDTATRIKAGNAMNTGAFKYFAKLKSVSGSAVETVGAYVFTGCKALTEANLPAATSIGPYAFGGCDALTEVSLPKATSIGVQAFHSCDSLTEVSLPKATSIGVQAFHSCDSLTGVSLPAVTSIGDFAFFNTALTEVSLPVALTRISDNAFTGCTKLTTITVDSGNPNYSAQGGMLLNKAGGTLIAYPGAKGAVILPSAITAIGDYAFNSCAALTTVNFPRITSVGNSAFQRCAALTEAHLPAAMSIGEFAFFNTALTEVSLPKATSIGGYAFMSCVNLAAASLPRATSIGDHTFDATGGKALAVMLGSTDPALGSGMFSHVGTAKTVTVKVPSGEAAWDGKTGTYSGGSPYAENWGNGFRGGGWDGSAFLSGNAVNGNITLIIETYTP